MKEIIWDYSKKIEKWRNKMKIEFNKVIKDEHGNSIDCVEINEDITCGDLIDVGDCATPNELYIKLAAKKSELAYSDMRKLDIATALDIINKMSRLFGGDIKKPLQEKQSQDLAEFQDKV